MTTVSALLYDNKQYVDDDYFEICLGTHAIFPLSVYYMMLDRSIMAISKAKVNISDAYTQLSLYDHTI